MNLSKLLTELNSVHPDTGSYDMDPVLAAAQINLVNRQIPKKSMTGSEIFNSIDASEWGALSTVEQRLIWDIVHLGIINPFGVEADLIIEVFPNGGATLTTLATIRQDTVSRAIEQGLGVPTAGDIERARA